VRIEQVVGNLLVNAAKYTDSGGGVAVTLERHGDSMVLRVADTGVGIEADVLPRIFDLFAPGRAVARPLARRPRHRPHAGEEDRRAPRRPRRSVQRRTGRGAEFVVTLPAAVGATLPAAPVASAPNAIGPASVIVVEDNADAAESLMLLLELMGLQVRVAGNGNVALAEARTRRPDVMLVDIGLPGMNGYQLARAIRSDPALAGIALVALTGYGQEDDRRQALLAGFDHHLVKPVEVDHIQRLMAELSTANAAVS
jgi:CheY-like chemotaxis protein